MPILTISKKIEERFDLVDVRLHMNLFEAGQAGADYDLRTIFDDSLVQVKPDRAVTFVDNHDTQQGQALESTVEEWFKPAAMLLFFCVNTVYHVSFTETIAISGPVCPRRFQRMSLTIC